LKLNLLIKFCKYMYDMVNLLYPVVVVAAVFAFFGNIRHPAVLFLLLTAICGAAFYKMELN